MNVFSLEGKHIVISGASSGIGQQCAIRCSEAGAKVSLLGRNKNRLIETLNALNNRKQHKYHIVDLTCENEVKETVSQIVKNCGSINGLINCAGISATLTLKTTNEKQLQNLFKSNVFSAFALTREVCKMGKFSKTGGSVIFMSSIMGNVGEVGKSLYGMTKGALQAGTKSLACELARKKIRVNSISPGLIVTPINEKLPHITDPEKRVALEQKHLLGLGKTDDVAYACIYLLSEASKWVTGTNLIVDGGYTAQ